jgi:hypothetical protein
MRRSALFGVLAALALGSGVASAQSPVSLEPPRAQLGFRFDGRWHDYDAGLDGRKQRYWEWVDLGLRGDVVSPRFVRFSLGARPGWRQTVSGGRLEEPERNASLLAWNAGIELLPNRPVSLSLFTHRDRDVRHNRIGDETQYDISETYARLTYQNRYFPVTVRYRARGSRRVGSLNPVDPGDALDPREDIGFRALRLSAQNSKTRLFFEHNANDDHLTGTTLVKTEAFLRHRFRWGKGSSIRSAIEYLDYDGTLNLLQFTWKEQVRLQHTWSVFSDYEFLLRPFRDAGLRGTDRLALVGVTVRPAGRLQTRSQGSWYARDFAGGFTGRTKLLQGLSYYTRLPLEGTLRASASVEYNRFRFEPPTNAGWLSVVDEPHVVDAAGRFTLLNTDVDATSVRVRRSDGTLVYQPGFDYRLLEDPPLTDVFVIPTGRIASGDTLLVDYRHRVLSDARTSNVVGSYSLTAAVGGLELFIHGTQTAVQASRSSDGGRSPSVGGRFQFEDLDETVFGFRLRRALWRAQFDFGFRWSDRRRDAYAQQGTELQGSVTIVPLGNLTLGIGGTGFWGNSTNGYFRSVTGGSTVRWMPYRTLLLHAQMTLWDRFVGGEGSTFVGGGVGASWQPGLLEVQVQFSHDRWRDGTNQTIDRLAVYIARRF